MTDVIKYRYAYDKNGEVIDVIQLSQKVERQGYTCVSCGTPLLAVLGDKRAWHFRHTQEIDCNAETYLHNLGKIFFLRQFELCRKLGVPFYVDVLRERICNACQDLGVKCPREPGVEPLDIAARYSRAAIEKGIEGVIADVLLSNEQGEKMLVEIFVTHRCEKEKIAIGLPIVEIQIKEECDLTEMAGHHITSAKVYNVSLPALELDLSGADFSDECWEKRFAATRQRNYKERIQWQKRIRDCFDSFSVPKRCYLCGQYTADWWHYDGRTDMCLCHCALPVRR